MPQTPNDVPCRLSRHCARVRHAVTSLKPRRAAGCTHNTTVRRANKKKNTRHTPFAAAAARRPSGNAVELHHWTTTKKCKSCNSFFIWCEHPSYVRNSGVCIPAENCADASCAHVARTQCRDATVTKVGEQYARVYATVL